MNTQIDITKNGTTTLATAGKYCDRNIDVNVNVEGGGAEPVEMVIKPANIEVNTRWSNDDCGFIEDENCDKYEYWIEGMFGATVKVKTSLPDGSTNFITDYEHDLYYEDQSNEFEVPITTNDGFELYLSCVRADGPPQVVVSFKGIVVEKEPDYTPCFDGTIEGEYVDENLTTLRLGAFAQCANIESVSFPNCTKINGANAFTACSKLTTVNLQSLKTIADGSSTFNSATRLQKINLPELTTITTTTRMFQNCTSITEIRMPKLSNTSIAAYTFSNCNKLETLVLGGAVLNPLANTQAFTNAGSQTANGLSIYVSDNLVEDYKKATNWSSLASKIKPMSELGE